LLSSPRLPHRFPEGYPAGRPYRARWCPGSTAAGRSREGVSDRRQVAHRALGIAALSSAPAAYGKPTRHATDQTDEPGDQGTADICTEISRGVDEYLCFVEAHVG